MAEYERFLSLALDDFELSRSAQELSESHYDATSPHCDDSTPPQPESDHPKHEAPYPGGPVRRVFGKDLGQSLTASLSAATGPAAAMVPPVAMLTTMAIMSVKGLLQGSLATIVDIVPPLIPPPIWIARPLPCLPMITGKNCIGSVLYPAREALNYSLCGTGCAVLPNRWVFVHVRVGWLSCCT